MVKKEDLPKSTVDNSFGIASVILGIIGILTLSVPGLILGIIGLIFSRKQARISNNIWARRGLILSILAIILSLIVIIGSIIWLANNPESLNQIIPQQYA